MADKTLDVRGLTCPLPALKAKKALAELARGGTLEVLATDPGAVADIQALCQATGDTLVAHSEAGGVFRFLIKHTS
ncbi:MAG: sulfurtransferase TusA family protein [Hyphomicrobiaceae bacterium]